MRRLAAQGLGNRDRDGHLLWDPRVGRDPDAVPEERVLDLAAPKTRGVRLYTGPLETRSRVLIWAVKSDSNPVPFVYTVNPNEPFTGLKPTQGKHIQEGEKRRSHFLKFSRERAERGRPLKQLYLLGDSYSLYFGLG